MLHLMKFIRPNSSIWLQAQRSCLTHQQDAHRLALTTQTEAAEIEAGVNLFSGLGAAVPVHMMDARGMMGIDQGADKPPGNVVDADDRTGVGAAAWNRVGDCGRGREGVRNVWREVGP
jgi:hypothetical protein